MKGNSIYIYIYIILLVVVYGCETWSITAREGCRLSVFRNMVLREVSEPKKKEETVGLHSEQLHDVHCALNRIRMIQDDSVKDDGMGGERDTYAGDETSIQGILWGKLKERDYVNNLGIDVRLI
jgi:hypothetical protein